ncbi:hypothetical protein ACFV3J_02310, partial [Streptomyces parvulus]
MSRLLGSVRARATLGATLVVAVALVAAGTAVLLSLRSNLLGEAGTQAERSAREVATELAVGTPYADLSLDVDDRPVQVGGGLRNPGGAGGGHGGNNGHRRVPGYPQPAA